MPRYRLLQKSYIFGEEDEDGPGSTRNIDQSRGETRMLWQGDWAQEPDATFFSEMGIDLPEDENVERGGEPNRCAIGDAEYSYELQKFVEGKWKYANHVHATTEKSCTLRTAR